MLSLESRCIFPPFDSFALFYKKSLNDWSRGNSEFCFPRISMFPKAKGNIEILGKQNPQFFFLSWRQPGWMGLTQSRLTTNEERTTMAWMAHESCKYFVSHVLACRSFLSSFSRIILVYECKCCNLIG